MNINHTNKQIVHDVLVKDLQKRLFKQYNEYKAEGNKILTDDDYNNTITLMVSEVHKCNNMYDVNELMLDYCDLFTSFDEFTVATTDGTLNYLLKLCINKPVSL